MQELEKILEEIESMEYPAEGIGCGLEDISITDRYESAEYGWNEAVERITEIIRNHVNDGWIPVEDERLWDILFEEACVEGEQARRIYNRLKETFGGERSEMDGKL